MSRITRDGTAEIVSRDKILRRERGQGNINFLCSADPVDPYSCYMCDHTHTHTHPWEEQCDWHIMTRMTGPDCAVMCNLINTHTHVSLILPWEDQREWHRTTRMTGPDCAVMCNLINIHTHTHKTSIIDPPLGGSMRVA